MTYKSFFKVVGVIVFAAIFCVGCGNNSTGGSGGKEDDASVYTITFDANGGYVSPNSRTTNADGTLASLPTPTREGYGFVGWYTAKTDGNAVARYPVFDKNTTIYAQWKLNTYRITFLANGGTVTPESGTTGDGWTLDSLPEPEREGYTFDGWFTAETGGAKVEESTVYNTATTIYARWTLNKYKITFDANGGSVTPDSGITGTGWKLASLPTPTKTGYRFNGWYTEEADGTPVTKDTVFNDDATIYAQWTLITYKVTFNANGGTVTPESDTTGDGQKLESLPTPVRDGYTFNGWFKAAAGGTVITEDTVFTNAATIYAQWTLNTYTITFDANGGTVTPDSGTTSAGWLLAYVPTPIRTGYTFNGWFTAEIDGDKVTSYMVFNENTTIYAQWTLNIYTVTFNSQGGNAVSSQSIKHGGKATEPDDPTRAGYTFGGWYKDAAYTTKWEFDTDTVTSNLTISAKWTLNIYTITFDANGGSVSEESGITGNGWTLESLPTPTRDGYFFDGWYTEETDGEKVTANTAFNENTTIYAQWTTIYTIMFDANEGSVTQTSGTTGAGGTLTSLPTPTRTGHTFGGWFTEETDGTQVTASTVFSADAIIYARWTVITYTVTFNVNSGSGTPPAAQTVNAGTAITLPSGADMTRGGYVFAGWNTQSTGTGSNYSAGASYTPTATITLYARWNVAPGNSKDNPISTTVGYSASHSISLNGEVWFKFEGDGNPVIFETKGNVVDTYMSVWQNSSILGSSNDNGGEGSNALYDYTSTTSGTTYYIQIKTQNQTSGTFSFVVTRPTANIRTNPISVTAGYSSSHVINSSSTHWFRFQGTGNSVVFETEGNVVTTSINLFVGDNTSAILTDNKRISFSTVSGTTYYISIKGNAGTYTFNVRNGAGDGSSRSFAIPVAVGYSNASYLTMSGAGAEMWFAFFGTGNPVTFKTTGNVVDTYMSVWQNSSILGSSNDNGGDGENALVRLNPSTSGSTYFIKITPQQSTQGSFNFVVTAE